MIPESVVDATVVTVANGTADATPTVRVLGGQRGTRKTVRANLSGEFIGLWLEVWVNFKRGLMRGIEGDSDKREAVMATLVLDHNLTDDNGQPYAKPLTAAALDDMAIDLFVAVMAGVDQAIEAGINLPKA